MPNITSRFAVAGASHIHMKDLALALQMYPQARVSMVYDKNLEKAQSWAERLQAQPVPLSELAKATNLNGIVVYSETSEHLSLVEQLPQRLPLFIEKPLGVGLHDSRKLYSFLSNTGRVFHCGYLLRCLRSLSVMRGALDRIGKVSRVEASFVHGGLQAGAFDICPWMLQKEPTGGMGAFGDLGIHLIDAVEQILQENLVPHSGILRVDTDKSEVDLSGTALLFTESGVQVALNTSITEPHGLIRMRVCGSQGYMHYEAGNLHLCNNEGSQLLLEGDHPGAEFGILTFLRGVAEGDYTSFVSPSDAHRQVETLVELYGKATVINHG